MVKWDKIDIKQIIEYCKDYRRRYGEYPSLRDIFYRFVDTFWSNTKASYKTLSKWLREKRLDGLIDWHIIRDGSGREYEQNDWTYKTPREHILDWFDLFIRCGSRYHLPVWTGQPKMVAVVCEKEADYPVIKALVDDMNADTAYARGYSGWRMLFEIAEKFIASKKDRLEIIALSDFDPSGGEKAERKGKDLTSFLLKALLKLGIINVNVEKIAVTKDHIEKFKLPHRPEDENEIAKLKRDPRFKTWAHGLYRVETAALRAKAPDYFDELIREAVRKHFDTKIYEPVKMAEEDSQKKVTRFFESQTDLLDELKENIETDELLE